MYEKVIKSLYQNDYFGILELLNAEDEKEILMPRVMREEKVDGLIFLGQMREEYINFIISQTQFPVFFLDTYVPLATFDTVISDGYYGTYAMTRYLISHRWEEPCISGTNGSGAVFFSGCVLGCVFCQNGPISRERFGKAISNMKTRGKSRTGTGVGICSKPSWRMETAWMPLCATATLPHTL